MTSTGYFTFADNWKEIATSLFKLGATSYGGVGIMGIMQAEVQEKRKWVAKDRFLEGSPWQTSCRVPRRSSLGSS